MWVGLLLIRALPGRYAYYLPEPLQRLVQAGKVDPDRLENGGTFPEKNAAVPEVPPAVQKGPRRFLVRLLLKAGHPEDIPGTCQPVSTLDVPVTGFRVTRLDADCHQCVHPPGRVGCPVRGRGESLLIFNQVIGRKDGKRGIPELRPGLARDIGDTGRRVLTNGLAQCLDAVEPDGGLGLLELRLLGHDPDCIGLKERPDPLDGDLKE